MRKWGGILSTLKTVFPEVTLHTNRYYGNKLKLTTQTVDLVHLVCHVVKPLVDKYFSVQRVDFVVPGHGHIVSARLDVSKFSARQRGVVHNTWIAWVLQVNYVEEIIT